MSTLREIREIEAKRRIEERTYEESREARHERYVTDAKKNGIRNLTAAEYQKTAELVPIEKQGLDRIIAWPLDAPAMFNGSNDPCDMWSGPCSCGAWPNEGI